MGRPRTWTDEQLREAVAASTSFKQTVAALGLRPQGMTYYDVKARITALALDTSHFIKRHYAKYPWTEPELRAAIIGATSRSQVLVALGQNVSGRLLVKLVRHMAELGIPNEVISGRAAGHRSWTDEQLRTSVANARSVAGAIRALGLIAAGGNYQQVGRRIVELGLDTSHFKGIGWSKDLELGPRPRVPLELVLVAGRWTGTQALKQRLIRAGLKHARCEICGWAERSPDGRLPLELDHINGDRNDNRLENLRILWPELP